MVVNENGEIAVRYRESAPKTVNGPSGRTYLFTVRQSVSLCYIHPSDWVFFSRITGGGCCGKGGPYMFWQASDRDVALWSAT